MTVYGPDITEAFEIYSSQFDDLTVNERRPIVDLNAINPLSDLRETWQNTTSNVTEHHLSTTAGVDETAYLETNARGQYTAGYQSQAGIGVRVPTLPSNDEELRFGYFDTDDNRNPIDGWAFGADADGLFVSEYRGGTEQRVYQENWSVNVANGTEQTDINPSEYELSLDKGHIFQIEFVYYGYGPAKMEVLTDEGTLILHEFTHDGSTSIENTNLPINAQIDNESTSADALDLFVGGRQFSVLGEETTNNRNVGHYRDSITVDDTKWYPAVSIKIKDGTDIGNIDFTHIVGALGDFEADTDTTAYRWQIRRGVTPNSVSWETPSSHVDTVDETMMKIDTTATDVQDGSGNLTGIFVSGGTLESGSKNESDILTADTSAEIVNGEVITLLFRASAGSSGTISEIFLRWTEAW